MKDVKTLKKKYMKERTQTCIKCLIIIPDRENYRDLCFGRLFLHLVLDETERGISEAAGGSRRLISDFFHCEVEVMVGPFSSHGAF